jgi:hypothetical protein
MHFVARGQGSHNFNFQNSGIVIASEAIYKAAKKVWIASSLRSSQ